MTDPTLPLVPQPRTTFPAALAVVTKGYLQTIARHRCEESLQKTPRETWTVVTKR